MIAEKLTLDEFRNQLGYFTGTEHYYKISPNSLITDGVKFVADQLGAYWLFQDTLLFLRGHEDEDGFAVIRLSPQGHGFKVEVGDGNDNWKPLFDGEFTDFPQDLMPFEFYVSFDGQHWVALLKSEY